MFLACVIYITCLPMQEHEALSATIECKCRCLTLHHPSKQQLSMLYGVNYFRCHLCLLVAEHQRCEVIEFWTTKIAVKEPFLKHVIFESLRSSAFLPPQVSVASGHSQEWLLVLQNVLPLDPCLTCSDAPHLMCPVVVHTGLVYQR
jgi:hypothetical protein